MNNLVVRRVASKLPALVGIGVLASALVAGQINWHTIAASGAPSALVGPPLGNLGPPSRSLPWTYGFALPACEVEASSVWTAFQFTIGQPVYINRFLLPAKASDPPPQQFGLRIYGNTVDLQTGEEMPGEIIWSPQEALVVKLEAGGGMQPNGCEVEGLLEIGPSLDPDDAPYLDAGTYWGLVYALDGDLFLYGGAPGGSQATAAWQLVDDSAWSRFETKDYVMPNFGANLLAGYDSMGASAPFDYSAWRSKELPGTCAYRISYQIAARPPILEPHKLGGTLRGCIELQGFMSYADPYRVIPDPSWTPVGWTPGGPDLDDYGPPMPPEARQCYDIVLSGPGSSRPSIVFMTTLDSEGNFSVGPIKAGVYSLRIFPRFYYIDKWWCRSDDVTYKQTYRTGFGMAHLPIVYPTLVEIQDGEGEAGVTDIGTVVLPNGDTDLDCEIGMADVSRVLLGYGSGAHRDDGCPPPWNNYYMSDDTNYDGRVGLPDLSWVLLNFGLSGPPRW